MRDLRTMGYVMLGLAGDGDATLQEALRNHPGRPIALVLGAEGPGLRALTRETCDQLVQISPAGGFGSLNVSNAAAIALYEARRANP